MTPIRTGSARFYTFWAALGGVCGWIVDTVMA